MNIDSTVYQKLPLYCIHDCSDAPYPMFGDMACQTEIRLTEDGNMFLDLNPYYNLSTRTCSKNGVFSKGIIHLQSFDINNPKCLGGSLYNPTMQIIPDLSFRIKIVFPLTRPAVLSVRTTRPIKLNELLQFIKNAYVQIYDEENKTSTPVPYETRVACSCVNNTPPKTKLLTYDEKNECSICYLNEESNQMISLTCNHTFHQTCISTWMSKGGKTCPLCRRYVNDCSECKNTGEVVTVAEYVEVPPELRLDQTRPSTDGAYGIYGHYLDNLYLSGLNYNRKSKMLRVSIVFY